MPEPGELRDPLHLDVDAVPVVCVQRELLGDLLDVPLTEPSTTLSKDIFNDLYREGDTTVTDALEQLWRQWNHDTGYTCDMFRERRYCEKFDTYLDDSDHARMHAEQTHGYDARLHPDLEDIHGIRSLSIGDIIEQDDQYYIADIIGWNEITITDTDS